MAERAMAVEEKLSDALHERLTQRFVDRRTAVLMRDLGGKGAGEFPVIIDDQGEVSVGSYAIGRLQGFSFEVDPAARHADRKMLLATAERRLAGEYEKRAAALVADTDQYFSLRTEPDTPVAILWRGHEVARLGTGKNLLSPRILLDRRIDSVSQRGREAVIERLQNWIRGQVERTLAPLRAAGSAAHDRATPAPVRSLLAMLVDEGGIVAREQVAEPLAALDRDQRRAIAGFGVRIGALDLYMPAVLKPEAMRWRSALRAAASGQLMGGLPPPSSVVLPAPGGPRAARLGFRVAGPQMINDMAGRSPIASMRRAGGAEAEPSIRPRHLSRPRPEAVARLIRDIGFRERRGALVGVARPGRRPAARLKISTHFAALAGLRRGGQPPARQVPLVRPHRKTRALARQLASGTACASTAASSTRPTPLRRRRAQLRQHGELRVLKVAAIPARGPPSKLGRSITRD
jgi:ATP-dependent RNA helicase SUPV3L1/SUV3